MRFVVLDVETTGLVPAHDRVVWLALAIVEDGGVTQRWSTLLDPGGGTPRMINGIPLTGKPGFADVIDDLLGFFDGGVLVAHNARFDLAFLKAEFARLERTMPALPVVCTMRMITRLEVAVNSLSLVDCCAAFDIIHHRRHRADEDVEATCQLLARLLKLAEQRGWYTADDLFEALRPRDADDHSVTFELTIDIDELFTNWLIETVGWRPDEEEVETALQRWREVERVAREARYAAMTPDHQRAHRLWDAIDRDDDRVDSWYPTMEALTASGCDELADAWKDWASRCGSDRGGRRREFDACRNATAAVLNEPGVSRKRVDDFIYSLKAAAERTAGGVDELIAWYAEHVHRLTALPTCGECGEAGNYPRGCLGGLACVSADVADRLVQIIVYDDRASERTFQRRAQALTTTLMREPNSLHLARLAAEQMRRYLEAGLVTEATAAWKVAQDHAVATHDLAAISRELRDVIGLLMYRKQYQEVITLVAPLADHGMLRSVDDRFRLLDELARAYERLGHIDDAVVIWQHAIHSGSNEQNTYERLSLTLERRNDSDGALAILELAAARFDEPLESLTKRAVRCHKRLGR